MDIWPKTELKDASSCKLGELVRYDSMQGSTLGFVAGQRGSDNRFLVFVHGVEAANKPSFFTIRPDFPVLSFGSDFLIVPDHLHCLGPNPYRANEIPGALWLTEKRWVFPVSGSADFGRRSYFSLEDFLTVQGDTSNVVAFPKWSIFLAGPPDIPKPPLAVISFGAENPRA